MGLNTQAVPGLLAPGTTVLVFLAWISWLAIVALLQKRLCLQYPGIRTVCRIIFAATAVTAILPACWVLVHCRNIPHILPSITWAFGIGVYLQTFLRYLLLTVWLVPSSLCIDAGCRPSTETGQTLLSSLFALTQLAGTVALALKHARASGPAFRVEAGHKNDAEDLQ